MHRLTLTAAVVASTLCAGMFAATRADAAVFGTASGLGVAADAADITENVQYSYGGRRYCWYADGWKGPGWYWCGYRARYGYGFGGPVGWRGWTYGAPAPVVVVPRRRYAPPPPPRYRRGPVVIVR